MTSSRHPNAKVHRQENISSIKRHGAKTSRPQTILAPEYRHQHVGAKTSAPKHHSSNITQEPYPSKCSVFIAYEFPSIATAAHSCDNVKPGNKVWKQGLATRLGNKVWQQGLATRPGNKVCQQGLATRPGNKVWQQGLVTRPGNKVWQQGLATRPVNKAW